MKLVAVAAICCFAVVVVVYVVYFKYNNENSVRIMHWTYSLQYQWQLVLMWFCNQFEDLNASRELTVNRAEKRAFSFDHRGSPGSPWQIVAQTEMAYSCRIVTLCSTVQVCSLLTCATTRWGIITGPPSAKWQNFVTVLFYFFLA